MTRTFSPPKNGNRYVVVAYLRVSLEEARTGSKTLETQEARVREYLHRQFGLNNIELLIYKEDGGSGGYGPEKTGIEKRTRPVFKKATNRVKEGDCDIWIVYDLSRFVRSLRWLAELREDVVLPTKTAFISVYEDIDIDTDEGWTTAVAITMGNEQQRLSGKRRTRDAAARRAELGYLQGQAGYGWQWQPLSTMKERERRGIVVVPEQAKWIVHAKDRFLAGWGLSKIAAEFHSLGVRSPSGLDEWTASIIGRVLRNPLHAGLVPVKKTKGTVQGVHWEQRLYDPEVYEQILQSFVGRKKFPTNTAKSENYLLSGLVTCAKCGKRLYPTQCGRREPIFNCMAGLSKGPRPCPNVQVKVRLIDEVVIDTVGHLARQPVMQEMLQQAVAEAVDQQDRGLVEQKIQLQTRLKEIDADLKKQMDAYCRELIGDDELKTVSEDLRSSKSESLQKLQAIELALADRHQQREEWIRRVRQVLGEFP